MKLLDRISYPRYFISLDCPRHYYWELETPDNRRFRAYEISTRKLCTIMNRDTLDGWIEMGKVKEITIEECVLL